MKIHNLTSFVLEGPDKVGKATQSNMLFDAIDDLGIRCHRIEVPSKNHACYDKIYDMLRRRKDGHAPAHDHPEIFQTYQAANRFDIQEDLRLSAQGGSVVVIFDRWHVSSWIYGLTAGMLPSKLEVISEGVPDPDITFILDGQGFDRPETKDDAYEDDSGFQDKVRSRYAAHGHSVASVVHVDADRSKKLVHEEIFTMVKRELLKQGML